MSQLRIMYPPKLQPGDMVRCISPSGTVSEEALSKGEKILSAHFGLIVKRGVHALEQYGRFAGTDRQRLTDLQEALNDPDCKAIFCSRGGYGLSRIVDQIDWSRFQQHPKWLIGYSDITLLHLAINKLNIASLHAPMVKSYGSPEAESSLPLLRYFLMGNGAKSYSFPLNQYDKPFRVSGRMIGGNLSMLLHAVGSELFDIRDGDILCLEEVAEPAYKVERMLLQLARTGAFEKIRAVLLGYMTQIEGQAEMQEEITAIVRKIVEPYPLALFHGLPFGHEFPHFPIVLGGQVEIIPDQALAYIHFSK